MMTHEKMKPPVWFWVVSVLSLFWNAMGVDQYLGQTYKTERWLSSMTEAQLDLVSSLPPWLTGAFAIAVFAGLLGSFGLLLKKKWAYMLFVVSLVAVIVQMGYVLALGHFDGLAMTIAIIAFAVFLVWFSKKSLSKGWIT